MACCVFLFEFYVALWINIVFFLLKVIVYSIIVRFLLCVALYHDPYCRRIFLTNGLNEYKIVQALLLFKSIPKWQEMPTEEHKVETCFAFFFLYIITRSQAVDYWFSDQTFICFFKKKQKIPIDRRWKPKQTGFISLKCTLLSEGI